MKELLKYRDNKKLINILVTLVGSTLYSLGIKWFIIPAKLKTGGFTGIAQIIYGIIDNTFGSFLSYDLGVGIIWFIINIPVFYLGFQSLGKRFTFLSFLAVLNGMITLAILPVPEILSEQGLHNDLMLSALLGGTITGVGVGITLKVGASTGGMDIISQYLSFKKDRPFGHYSFILNGIIILIVGLFDSWIYAFYTIINLFISTLVIDKIHTRHNKLTLLIVTDKKDELIETLHKRIYRGITIIPSIGAYSRQEKTILMMVISSFELYNVLSIIKEVDDKAFTNVFKSQAVYGNFYKHRLD